MVKNQMEKVQILEKIPEILSFLKIWECYVNPYFLHAGTLLGALRNGKQIPWDTDSDIMFDLKFGDILKKMRYIRNENFYKDPGIKIVLQEEFHKKESIRQRLPCKNEVC